MTTCKRCDGMCIVGGGEWLNEKTVTNLKTGEKKTLPAGFGFVSRECPDCKGTGEVEDDDSEREGDNTNKGDGDGDT